MRQLVSIILMAGLLVGCGDKISGRFVGKYVEQIDLKYPMTYTITNEGDHYGIKAEYVRDYISQYGITKNYMADEVDKYTIKTKQGRIITLSKDGKTLQPAGLKHPMIRVE